MVMQFSGDSDKKASAKAGETLIGNFTFSEPYGKYMHFNTTSGTYNLHLVNEHEKCWKHKLANIIFVNISKYAWDANINYFSSFVMHTQSQALSHPVPLYLCI